MLREIWSSESSSSRARWTRMVMCGWTSRRPSVGSMDDWACCCCFLDRRKAEGDEMSQKGSVADGAGEISRRNSTDFESCTSTLSFAPNESRNGYCDRKNADLELVLQS